MDERQELNAGRAAMLVLLVIVLGSLAVLTWEYIRTQEVTNTAAIVTMLGAGGLFALFLRLFGAEAPRNVLGQELPTGATREEKRERVRSYATDAGLFAVAMAALSGAGLAMGDAGASEAIPGLLQGTAGMILGGVLAFVVTFALMFGLNYASGEQQSRAVGRKLAAEDVD